MPCVGNPAYSNSFDVFFRGEITLLLFLTDTFLKLVCMVTLEQKCIYAFKSELHGQQMFGNRISLT
jgi:hypothetical protein